MTMLSHFAATGGNIPLYIEDVFSTWLYTGNGSTQTINNGIDLAGKGGLVWTKARVSATSPYHQLYDTAQGASKSLSSDLTQAAASIAGTSFLSSGVQFSSGNIYSNESSITYASWTFRKQPKFFDVVTWTGNGVNGRNIPHSLGSDIGFVVVKPTSTTGDWVAWHRTLGSSGIILNSSSSAASYVYAQYLSQSTSTNLFVGTTNTNVNGVTYVAYLFAHNAGGFGLTGTDNVISCGSFTTDGSGNATVTLGYEPQWLLVKTSNSGGEWRMLDSMRGWSLSGSSRLAANSSSQELSGLANNYPTATGFVFQDQASVGYIYIAIRRGPMKVPTSGTSVFSPIAVSSPTGTTQTTNFVIDSQWKAIRGTSNSLNSSVDDRLRGVSTTTTASGRYMVTSDTIAEDTINSTTRYWSNTGFQTPPYYNNHSMIYWNFARAPKFFDQVCYTGNGSSQTLNHNLGVAPELWIIKSRTDSGTSLSNWGVYAAPLGLNQWARVNTAEAFASAPNTWTGATATTFSVSTAGGLSDNNRNTASYVAYLFASCPGVSKVGSYTGNGTNQTINCGFTGGARFVLIKRTDSTGDWYVWDTARGIVSANDPHLSLNTTAAEVTTNDSIDTNSTGFVVNQVAATNINVNGATYIYLAIA